MVSIHLDGERLEIGQGTTLGDVLKDHPAGCSVAIIRPATQEQAKTDSLAISTTAGQITVELSGEHLSFLESPSIVPQLMLHWGDRYAAAFGPFPADIHPKRKPHLYERGDVILGCGGYDPARSYLIFSKSRHSADHGADESGGVIGTVISGRGVLDRWSTDARVTKIEPVISWADTSRSFTTTDPGLILEDGMLVVTRVGLVAQGFSTEKVTTEAAASVEHMLLALQSGRFVVDRATSTHIADLRRAGTDVPREYRHPRREGAVTVRATGKSSGGVFFYRTDVPSSMVHSIAGQVVQGIELVRLAREHDVIAVKVQPERIDLLGQPIQRAKEIASQRGFTLVFDKDIGERIVVSQEPGTTLDVLAERKVTVTTAPSDKVIDIELDDANAPVSCGIFRKVTGLVEHDAGMLPVFFKFDDVVLFRPEIPVGIKINPENPPADEAPAAGLGITNDSRKGAGLVGVRLSANKEFGPTSEPFEGTNMIGRVIDTGKLKKVKERENVYIREVRR
ncbi:MAG TPA: methanogenesis marker 3 protein [Methanoregula sp.]|nr:methanogenesis marker 3 protein [Methanoregula sp.]